MDAMLDHAAQLGFFRLVALVERLAKRPVRIGSVGPVQDEPIRFRHDPSLAFSAADVSRVNVTREEPLQVDVVTSFLGLTGAVTPLPLYLAEEVLDDDGAEVQRAFLDLFHHRLLSLLYRGVIKYQLSAEASAGAEDAWAQRLLALAGVDAHTQRPALEVRHVLRLLPALVQARRSPDALEKALGVLLGEAMPGASITVEPFAGEWVPLDERDRCRLGVGKHQLGRELVLGTRVYDVASKFRIRVGPVDAEGFRQLGPGGSLRAMLDATVALFVNDPLAYEVAVTIDATRGRLRLSTSGDGPRLGVDAWLGQYDPKTASVRMRADQPAHARAQGACRT